MDDVKLYQLIPTAFAVNIYVRGGSRIFSRGGGGVRIFERFKIF